MEYMRTGSMTDYQHLNVEINVPTVTVRSALICETATGVNVAKSVTVKAGFIFEEFTKANAILNTASSHLSLPVITGTGFADSLVVATAGNCTLFKVVLTGGKGAKGGAVRVDATATLNLVGVIFRNNQSPSQGGGLFVAMHGVAAVQHSLFYANVATMTYVGQSGGGAIHNRGTLVVAGSTFNQNIVRSVSSQASGGAVYNVGNATVRDCSFILNEAQGNMVGEGGALSTYRKNTLLEVAGCTFSNNSATHSGGGVFAQGFMKLTSCFFEFHSAVVGPTLRVTPDAAQPEVSDVSIHIDVLESEYAGSDGYNEFLKPDNFRTGPW